MPPFGALLRVTAFALGDKVSYKNLPLSWKVGSLLVSLGVISLGGAIYSAKNSITIDSAYSDLIDGEAKAQVALARANRRLSDELGAIYLTAAASNDASLQRAKRERAEAAEVFAGRWRPPKKMAPRHAEEIRKLQRQFDTTINEKCRAAITMGESSTDSATILKALELMLDTCEPAIRQLSADIGKVTVAIEKEMEGRSGALTDDTLQTSYVTLTAIALAVLATLAAGILLMRRGVVQPLQALIAVMGDIGRGKLAVTVPGADRKDEVGAIANALELLRTQLSDAERARQEQERRDAEERERLDARNSLAERFVQRMTQLASAFAASSNQVAGSARDLSSTAEQTPSRRRM